MALTTCPDCQRQISTEASTCPGCGRPMNIDRVVSTQQAAVQVVVKPTRSRGIYIILGLLLGLLGIHNFYAGYYGKGAIQLAITLVLGWIYIGIVITGLWVLVDLFSVDQDANGIRMT